MMDKKPMPNAKKAAMPKMASKAGDKKEMMIAIPATKKPSNICPGCCYSDGRENYDDGSWICHRCGDSGENE